MFRAALIGTGLSSTMMRTAERRTEAAAGLHRRRTTLALAVMLRTMMRWAWMMLRTAMAELRRAVMTVRRRAAMAAGVELVAIGATARLRTVVTEVVRRSMTAEAVMLAMFAVVFVAAPLVATRAAMMPIAVAIMSAPTVVRAALRTVMSPWRWAVTARAAESAAVMSEVRRATMRAVMRRTEVRTTAERGAVMTEVMRRRTVVPAGVMTAEVRSRRSAEMRPTVLMRARMHCAMLRRRAEMMRTPWAAATAMFATIVIAIVGFAVRTVIAVVVTTIVVAASMVLAILIVVPLATAAEVPPRRRRGTTIMLVARAPFTSIVAASFFAPTFFARAAFAGTAFRTTRLGPTFVVGRRGELHR